VFDFDLEVTVLLFDDLIIFLLILIGDFE
jgi:hypothetical protein